MIEEEKIVKIILKELEGDLNSEEQIALNAWLQDDGNVIVYNQYQELWGVTDTLAQKKENFASNSDLSWMAIEQHITVEQPKRRLKVAYGVAASIALILMIFGANYLLNTNSNQETIQYVLQPNEKDTLTFPDGSQAYLFGPCSMTYPKHFAANERSVSINGFAYFDIAHDESRPFEVVTEKGRVEVLGTSFTVDTRQQEAFTVACLSGKVRMIATSDSHEQKHQTILTRNKRATFSSQSKQLDVTNFKRSDLGIAIPVRNMTFENKPLGEILDRIEYNYGVTIQLENKDLLGMKYSTALNDTTIEDFFNELKITFKVEVIQTEPENYILKGGSLN